MSWAPPSGTPSLFVGLSCLVLLLGACTEQDECPQGARRCNGTVAETCVYSADNELGGHLVWSREECGPNRFCQVPEVPGTRAFCAIESEPDPIVPAELQTLDVASRCVGDDVVTWTAGYRTALETCEFPLVCVDTNTAGFDPACVGEAYCVQNPEADPRCLPGVATFCADESTISYCNCGFVTDAHPCADPGPTCVQIEVASNVPLQGACR